MPAELTPQEVADRLAELRSKHGRESRRVEAVAWALYHRAGLNWPLSVRAAKEQLAAYDSGRHGSEDT